MSILKLLVICNPFSLASAHEIKIEFIFVDERSHSSIGVKTPNAFEKELTNLEKL